MSRLTCALSGVTYVLDSDTSGRARTTKPSLTLGAECTIQSENGCLMRRSGALAIVGPAGHT